MHLDELHELIQESLEEYWNVITCWSMGATSFLHAADPEPMRFHDAGPAPVDPKDDQEETQSHSMRAAYMPDLSVGLAWGLPANNKYHADWTEHLPDPECTSFYVDLFYNGMLVDRIVGVHVDGARCYMPSAKSRKLGDGTTEWSVTRFEHDLFRLIDGFGKISEFDNYMEMTGLVVRG
jgi:hypothetical protein